VTRNRPRLDIPAGFRKTYYSRAAIEDRRLSRQRRPRMTVEKFGDDYLDVKMFKRAGLLRERWVTWSPFLRWPAIEKIHACRWCIRLQLNNGMVEQNIPVSWTGCHFGGSRPWLHCRCGRRVARLFKGLAGYYCRPCVGNPIYASQTKSTQGRRHFQACKLRLLLDGVASLTAPFPARPRGMHRKTYARLRRRAEKLEEGLSLHLRHKPTGYPSLVYHLPPADLQMI
jgi:hypothetical protein